MTALYTSVSYTGHTRSSGAASARVDALSAMLRGGSVPNCARSVHGRLAPAQAVQVMVTSCGELRAFAPVTVMVPGSAMFFTVTTVCSPPPSVPLEGLSM
jgi:hypothetical protein